MSAAAWAVIICGAVIIIGAEAVRLTLKRRLRRKEAAFERDFGARVDQELPGFYEGESE